MYTNYYHFNNNNNNNNNEGNGNGGGLPPTNVTSYVSAGQYSSSSSSSRVASLKNQLEVFRQSINALTASLAATYMLDEDLTQDLTLLLQELAPSIRDELLASVRGDDDDNNDDDINDAGKSHTRVHNDHEENNSTPLTVRSNNDYGQGHDDVFMQDVEDDDYDTPVLAPNVRYLKNNDGLRVKALRLSSPSWSSFSPQENHNKNDLTMIMYARPFVLHKREMRSLPVEDYFTATCAVAMYNLALAYHLQGIMPKESASTMMTMDVDMAMDAADATEASTATTTTATRSSTTTIDRSKLETAHEFYRQTGQLLNNIKTLSTNGVMIYMHLAVLNNAAEACVALGLQAEAMEFAEGLIEGLPVLTPAPDSPRYRHFVKASMAYQAFPGMTIFPETPGARRPENARPGQENKGRA